MNRVLRLFCQLYLWTLLALALIVPIVWGDKGLESNLNNVLCNPSWSAWFGCDSLGRDLFVRMLQGARVSIGIGISSALISFTLGVGIGYWSGLSKSYWDHRIMRTIEILMSLPQLVLVAVMIFILQDYGMNGMWSYVGLTLAIGTTTWMSLARITRNLVREEMTESYIEAARALGASRWRLALYHIWPNIRKAVLVAIGLQISQFLLFESLLSFVGIGIQPPVASWGLQIQEGWKTLGAYPQLVIFPGILLFGTVFSLNYILSDWGKSLGAFQPPKADSMATAAEVQR